MLTEITEKDHAAALAAGLGDMTIRGLRRLVKHIDLGKPILLTGGIIDRRSGKC